MLAAPAAKHGHGGLSMQDYRADLCTRTAEVSNGTRTVQQALAGLNLHVAVTLFDDNFINYDKATGKYGGYLYHIMNRIALKGGFTVHHHQQTLRPGQGFTSWMLESLQHFDVNGIYWVETVNRMKSGTACPYPFLDTSMYFFLDEDLIHESLWDHITSFARPFDTSVWLVFMGIALATAILYVLFERKKNEDEGMTETPFRAFGNAIYLTFFTATQGGGVSPVSKFGKVLAVSWAWTVLLFLSSYTASLASIFVVSRSKNKFNNIDQLIGTGQSLCTWGAGYDHIVSRYPTYNSLHKSTRNPILDLVDGKCAAALVEKVFIDLAQNNRQLNPECTLKTVGHAVVPAFGGFMVGTAYDKCSSLIARSMEVLFFEIKSEGALKQLYQDLLAENTDSENTCNVNEEDSTKLSLSQMSGIFYIHGFLTLCAAAVFIVHRAFKKRLEIQEEIGGLTLQGVLSHNPDNSAIVSLVSNKSRAEGKNSTNSSSNNKGQTDIIESTHVGDRACNTLTSCGVESHAVDERVCNPANVDFVVPFLSNYGYEAACPTSWQVRKPVRASDIPVLRLQVNGYEEWDGNAWYHIECGLFSPRCRLLRWKSSHEFIHLQVAFHDKVKASLGSAYDEHFIATPFVDIQNSALHRIPREIAEQLNLWFWSLATCVSNLSCQPMLVAALLMSLQIPALPAMQGVASRCTSRNSDVHGIADEGLAVDLTMIQLDRSHVKPKGFLHWDI